MANQPIRYEESKEALNKFSEEIREVPLQEEALYEESQEALNKFSEEFLEALLQEEAIYPWNPAEPEAEAYFAELEQNFSLADWSDSEEIAPRAETLFSHLHQCWASSTISRVKKSLFEQFGDFVPSEWLELIAAQAEQIVSANLSPLQQLVQCVKPLLENWAEEDLQVFARPLVYAMRGNTFVRQAQWDELSSIEKVRVSMAIAQYAFSQLQAEKREAS
ncbi:MAG: hypothetical protein AB4426_30205 [Xenococcaceae cyanobacterium]